MKAAHSRDAYNRDEGFKRQAGVACACAFDQREAQKILSRIASNCMERMALQIVSGFFFILVFFGQKYILVQMSDAFLRPQNGNRESEVPATYYYRETQAR